MEQKIYSVSQVTAYIQTLMDKDGILSRLCIQGEISNYKLYPSGHHYFSLKDGAAAIRCVMFKSAAQRLRFRPADGMRVLAVGRISVFPRDGIYQLYCTGLMPAGVGDLHAAFEALKAKLQAEGLFDPAHKKPIPRYPGVIALITSPAGAAVQDMLRILRKRYPLAKVRIFGVRVQGAEAPAELCGAIRYVNHWNLADVIITGRGGGSLEDLWAFNDENLARTIFASRIPVISAVGHEPDVTISDYVADLRAATPSNAAELAVPDRQELQKRLNVMWSGMSANLSRQVRLHRQRLNVLASARAMQSPTAYLEQRRLLLDSLLRRLCAAQQQRLSGYRRRSGTLASALDAMSPLKVLGRGYAMAQTQPGRLLQSVQQVAPGDSITLFLADGQLTANVQTITQRQGEFTDERTIEDL